MTTTVKVTAGETRAKVATLMFVGEETRANPTELAPGEEQSFVIHNTLDLTVAGALAEVEVQASDWPVRVVIDGEEGDPIAPGESDTITLAAGSILLLTEQPDKTATAA